MDLFQNVNAFTVVFCCCVFYWSCEGLQNVLMLKQGLNSWKGWEQLFDHIYHSCRFMERVPSKYSSLRGDKSYIRWKVSMAHTKPKAWKRNLELITNLTQSTKRCQTLCGIYHWLNTWQVGSWTGDSCVAYACPSCSQFTTTFSQQAWQHHLNEHRARFTFHGMWSQA